MAYLIGSIPYMHGYARREYTRNLTDRFGQFVPVTAYGVRCVRGHSLWFQCALHEPQDGSPNNTGGAHFTLPITALCWRPCEPPARVADVQPWDVFSSTFGVTAFDFVARGAVEVLPARLKGQYRFTLDFTDADLADDPDQHKMLHVVALENGRIGAYPNNRLLWHDSAFWEVMTEQPDFLTLAHEVRAEGNQHLFWPERPERGGQVVPFRVRTRVASR